VVNRGYTVTTGAWIRGILKSEYGVDLTKVTWACTDEEHVAEYQPPPYANYALHGKSAVELLVAGAAEATVGDVRTDSAAVRPLIAEPREAGFAYFKKTGIYPLNHTVVIQSKLVESDPTLAPRLFQAFKASKDAYLAELAAGGTKTPADQTALALQAVVGDPFPIGVAANAKAIETLVDFSFDQKIIPAKPSLESLFAPGTLTL
jgi:4,5-dihydroxyphthalate decarboxylase